MVRERGAKVSVTTPSLTGTTDSVTPHRAGSVKEFAAGDRHGTKASNVT